MDYTGNIKRIGVFPCASLKLARTHTSGYTYHRDVELSWFDAFAKNHAKLFYLNTLELCLTYVYHVFVICIYSIIIIELHFHLITLC